MRRLGYERYGAQGGDFGAVISPGWAGIDPEQVVGVHVNAAAVGFIPSARIRPRSASLTDAEQARLDRLRHFMTEAVGYCQIQATRPQTLAYGLTDSPVGQLAWIVEKFKEWTDPAAELPEDAVDRDQLLTNVMLYWLTGTAGVLGPHCTTRAAHAGALGPSAEPRCRPGWRCSPRDVGDPRASPSASNNIVHWSEFDRGGHFAAMEAPDLLVGDVRAFFRGLR